MVKKVNNDPESYTPKKRGRPKKNIVDNQIINIGDMVLVEEESKNTSRDVPKQNKLAKKFLKTSVEKVKSMPQTYIEDTFDINNNNSDTKEIIENAVHVKNKKMISKKELLENNQFKMKLKRLISQIEYEKSFNVLLDFISLSKNYKTFHIDNETDEIDILLLEIVIYFKKKLINKPLAYTDYQKIDAYFETVKTLYNRFQFSEGIIKDDLKTELENALAMNNYIKYMFF